jgi:hypothetical protein
MRKEKKVPTDPNHLKSLSDDRSIAKNGPIAAQLRIIFEEK